MAIEAENLTVSRAGRTVLQDVSLRIEDGECVSVVGPNGAGKSTLMSALLGLLPASGGQVRLDGSPINRLKRRHIARKIAYVPQIHEGYLGFSVRNVVEAGRYVHVEPLAGLSDSDRRAVDEAVLACDIGDLLERPVHALSGGERQKVWIAAAVAQESPTLFLDEPTTALDPKHQAELIRIMRRFAAGSNTLMVISHDLNLPIALGGRVIVIRAGKVAFDGPVESLLDVNLLEQHFGTAFALHRDPESDGVSIQLRI